MDSGPIGKRVAAVAAALVGLLVGRVFLRGLAVGWGGVRLAYRIATLSALRRCPDCRRLINSQARVCRHCGRR